MPQRVDEKIGRDSFVPTHEEQREQVPLLRRPGVQLLSVPPDGERPEHAEADSLQRHACSVT